MFVIFIRYNISNAEMNLEKNMYWFPRVRAMETSATNVFLYVAFLESAIEIVCSDKSSLLNYAQFVCKQN